MLHHQKIWLPCKWCAFIHSWETYMWNLGQRSPSMARKSLGSSIGGPGPLPTFPVPVDYLESWNYYWVEPYKTFMKQQFHMAQPDMSDNLSQVTKEGLSKDLWSEWQDGAWYIKIRREYRMKRVTSTARAHRREPVWEFENCVLPGWGRVSGWDKQC